MIEFINIHHKNLKMLCTSILVCVMLFSCISCGEDFSEQAIKISDDYNKLKSKFVSLATSLGNRSCIEEKSKAEQYIVDLNNTIALFNDFIDKNNSKEGFDELSEELGNKLKRYDQYLTNLNKSCDSKDSDGDGIPDIKDECDTLAAETLHGCPDPDGDGFYNNDDGTKIDECPDTKGIEELKGCPKKNGPPPVKDSDGDGIIDSKDACPRNGGLKKNQGCPDKDFDGFYDVKPTWESLAGKFDLCVGTFGTFNGCLDDDKDKIHDGIDQCIGVYGALPNGCPCQQDITPIDLSAINLRESCTEEVKKDRLVIQPKTNVILKDFRLFGHTNSSGDVVFSLTNTTNGSLLISNRSSYVNSFPTQTQILTSEQLLKAGSRYELIVEAKGSSFALYSNTCKGKTFTTADLKIEFQKSAFVHQLNLCK